MSLPVEVVPGRKQLQRLTKVIYISHSSSVLVATLDAQVITSHFRKRTNNHTSISISVTIYKCLIIYHSIYQQVSSTQITSSHSCLTTASEVEPLPWDTYITGTPLKGHIFVLSKCTPVEIIVSITSKKGTPLLF